LRSRLLLASSLVLTFLALMHPAWAWSNGGYSADPNNPDYGTHDWIAERALDWLPVSEKALILTYRAAYLYGTELPDNSQAADGIGDATTHHIYYRSSGVLQDDASARRALEMQSQVSSAIATGDYASAAKWTGAMTHYIADVAVFGHVMGSSTDWGTETHHSDYEDHVQTLTDSPGASAISLSFDGILAAISPYDAALALAHDTTFDESGAGHTAAWMDQHYNWSDSSFQARAFQSINLAVNYVVEAVHAVWSPVTIVTTQSQVTTATQAQTTSVTQSLITTHVVINEFEENPPGPDAGAEFVELFNPTSQPVDIGNWIIHTTHPPDNIEIHTIPPGTLLPAGGFWHLILPGQFIDNEEDSLVLLNGLGQTIDQTPSKVDNDDDPRSWQRYPDGSDNWVYAPSTAAAVNVPEFVSPMLVGLVLVASTLVTMNRRPKRGLRSRRTVHSSDRKGWKPKRSVSQPSFQLSPGSSR